MKRMGLLLAALLIGITAALAGCIFPEGGDDYGEHGYYHGGEEHHHEHHDEGRGGERHDDHDEEHR